MVNSALAELSKTSKESVGVFDVLFVTSIDLIIIIYLILISNYVIVIMKISNIL